METTSSIDKPASSTVFLIPSMTRCASASASAGASPVFGSSPMWPGAYSNQDGFLGWTASANNDTGVAWQTVGVDVPNTNVVVNVTSSADDLTPQGERSPSQVENGTSRGGHPSHALF